MRVSENVVMGDGGGGGFNSRPSPIVNLPLTTMVNYLLSTTMKISPSFLMDVFAALMSIVFFLFFIYLISPPLHPTPHSYIGH